MDSLTITIGRNIGNVPMELELWKAFKLTVWCHAVNAFPNAENRFIGNFEGVNSWTDDDQNTIREDSYMVQVVGTVDREYVDDLKSYYLPYTAHVFHQDAIAMSVGTSDLYTPNNEQEA